MSEQKDLTAQNHITNMPNENESEDITVPAITSQPIKEKKPIIKPFIDQPPNGEGTKNQPLGSEAHGTPFGCGPDHIGKWLQACGRC
ncbi:uncharacterized protein L201_003480 [Kwoniella dendrophila CBS 6074]|uniref:Uncharacterized protein n=1 Tax=Kwoniella dendrophila CBS 6074 TaxID=1295534 RepID=A0AAX4JUT8_9TREE